MVLKAANSSGVKAGRGLGTFALGICALVRLSPVMFGNNFLRIQHKSILKQASQKQNKI